MNSRVITISVWVGALALAVILVLVLNLVWKAPTQHDPATYGAVVVELDPAWTPTERGNIARALDNLERLGPDFNLTPTPRPESVRIVRWHSPDCGSFGVGRHTLGTHVVEVDPACTTGPTALRAAVAHELGHALGMHHVCRQAGPREECSPVGHGDAMMNPQLGEFDAHGEYTVPQDEPTALDLAEFRRVFRAPALDGGR